MNDITKHLEIIQAVRSQAKSVSSKANRKMIHTFKAKNPPAQYKCGDDVIIRRFSSSSKRKSARDKQQRIVTGRVVRHSNKSGNYKVNYTLDGKQHEEWISVSDLTSLTLQDEKDRHQHSPSNKCFLTLKF